MTLTTNTTQCNEHYLFGGKISFKIPKHIFFTSLLFRTCFSNVIIFTKQDCENNEKKKQQQQKLVTTNSIHNM